MKRMKSYAQAQIVNCFREVYSRVAKTPITEELKEETKYIVLNKLYQLKKENELIEPPGCSFNEIMVTQSPLDKVEGRITIKFPHWLKEQFEDEEV